MPLNPATWQRLQALFHQACALPEPQRAAFAKAQAGDEPELLHELLGLLAADVRATELPRPGLLGTLLGGDGNAAELPPGTRFGPWAIDRLIGRGGMGQVYLGHRADGAYEREVAIKLIAATALDAQQRAVFEFECRLLALPGGGVQRHGGAVRGSDRSRATRAARTRQHPARAGPPITGRPWPGIGIGLSRLSDMTVHAGWEALSITHKWR